MTEGDLLDVLRMHGAQKQLRQVLTSLKKDKLIRWSVYICISRVMWSLYIYTCLHSLQKMESEEGNFQQDGQKHLRMIHYYFINYKQFVNVVKYRLDHMRRKLEMEEKTVRDRAGLTSTALIQPNTPHTAWET